MKKESMFFSRTLQMVFYIALLVLTPFLMLQNYLQRAIGNISRAGFDLGSVFIPYVVLVGVIFIGSILFISLRKMDRWRWITLLNIIVLFRIGHLLSDYYFNHSFYELQFNWHYFAYGIFTFIAYRLFKEKGYSDAKMIKSIFALALSASTFDEVAQVFISSRVFDISDIGKDGWGTIIGLLFVFFMIEHGRIVEEGWKVRHKKIKDYFQSPLSLIVFEAVFVLFLLFNSSLFTDKVFWLRIVVLTVLSSLLVFIILHLSQRKVFKRIYLGILILLILVQSVSFLLNRNKGITYHSNGLTVYKGFVIPFYDIMIFPNGTFRLVDKKSAFNARDLNTIFDKKSDILILGAGETGKGGRGVIEHFKEWDFIYNEHTLRAMQVFRLKNSRAIKLFNKLQKEGKNVLFIIHTTEE